MRLSKLRDNLEATIRNRKTTMADATTDELKDALTPLLGRIPSGVFILVAGDDADHQTGLLASWIQQASFEPPQVTVAVNKSRYLNDWIKPGSSVTLNQVRKQDPVLFKHFGRGFEPDVDAFAGVDSRPATNGLPLLPDAMLTLEGRVESSMDAGDHVIYLVTVTSGTAHQEVGDFDPFIHVRKNGFSY